MLLSLVIYLAANGQLAAWLKLFTYSAPSNASTPAAALPTAGAVANSYLSGAKTFWETLNTPFQIPDSISGVKNTGGT